MAVLVVERKCVPLFLVQVVEQGTQMTPVGEVVTTHMGRLSMLAKVNETGVQVDFFSKQYLHSVHSCFSQCVRIYGSSKRSFEGDPGPGRTFPGVHSC